MSAPVRGASMHEVDLAESSAKLAEVRRVQAELRAEDAQLAPADSSSPPGRARRPDVEANPTLEVVHWRLPRSLVEALRTEASGAQETVQALARRRLTSGLPPELQARVRAYAARTVRGLDVTFEQVVAELLERALDAAQRRSRRSPR